MQRIQRKLQELQQQNGQQRFARYHRNDVFNQCYRQTIEECNRVKYKDWITAVEQGVAQLASKCDKIHVIGSSMGAVLALHIASIFPINSLVLIHVYFYFKTSKFNTIKTFSQINPCDSQQHFDNLLQE